jgi:polar amino acid transport system substrate-binding protein
MRTPKALVGLALAAVLAAACTGAAATPSPLASTTPLPSTAPTAAPSVAAASVAAASPTTAPTPSPTANACAAANLTTKTAGKLTFGSDNPAYDPYFLPSSPNPDPWAIGDPTNGQGFEDAVAYAIADKLGFTKDQVIWKVETFGKVIKPGPKDFDVYFQEVSYTAERAKSVDLTDGYYDVAQAVVALKADKISSVTTVAGLKDFQFGAQVGTTSLDAINTTIAPSKDAKIYDSNDLALKALQIGQIDGLVTDLPTAFYMASQQIKGGVIVGQFPAQPGGEHFSAVLDTGSPLTACVNQAIAALKSDGTLAKITQEWLADKANAPVFQP